MELSLGFLSQLFDNVPLGIVVLDATGKVVVYNRAEEQLAGRHRAAVIGQDFFAHVAPCMNVRQLAGEFRRNAGNSQLDVDVEYSFPFPVLQEPRDVRVKMTSFEVERAWFGVVMVQDVSARAAVERMKQTLQDLLVHDLKNPLSVVSVNLDFIESLATIRDNKDAVEAVADAITASTYLGGMLVNLLDITRLETNAFPIDRKPTDVTEMLGAVARGNRALAESRGGQISVGTVEPVLASADAAALRRALDNLVDNAVRHAKRVTLSVHKIAGIVAVEVLDDGPGIPAELRAGIFEKYTQGDNSKRASHNRGLGLTFVKLVARAHGGEASVSCPDEGGSCFRITLAEVAPG